MHADSLRRPVLPLAIAATLLSALLILLPAWTASAHDSLVSSDPAAGSTAQTLPDELTLTFSAALIPSEGGTAVVVTDAEGNDVADGAPEIDGAVLIQKLKSESAIAGEYSVLWHVVSSDGHPTEGEFAFTVTAASAPTTEPTTDPTTAPSDSPEPVASPTPSESAAQTPDATTTQGPDVIDSSPASGWIWAISIAGILVVAAAVTWVAVRARRSPSGSDSDTPAEG